MLKIKKLSIFILMFSTYYIFSSIGEFGAGGLGKDIAAFEESQTKKLEYLKSEVGRLYTIVGIMIGQNKIDTPRYHQKVEELRDTQQELMKFQKSLGVNEETWMEVYLRLIPRDKQEARNAEELDKIAKKEKMLKYVVLASPLEEQSLPLPPIESTYDIPEINERPLIRPQSTKIVEYTPPSTFPGRRQETTENVSYQTPTQVNQPTMNPRKNPKLLELKTKKEDLEQQKNALRSQRDSYAKNSKDYKSKDIQFKNFEKNTYLPAKKAYEDYARSLGL